MVQKDSFYFPHDFNARGDEKMVRLIRIHGMTGYGVYWVLIEKLYEAGGKIASDYETLAYDLREDLGLVKSIVEESGLFYAHGSTSFGSRSVDRRLQRRREKSEKARQSFNRTIRAQRRNGSNDHRTIIERSSNDQLERKGKEIKEKEIKKQEKITDSVPAAQRPTVEEVKTYCLERGNRVDPQKWHDHYTSNGWKVGKNAMKDWRAAVRTWERNDGFSGSGGSGSPLKTQPTAGKYDGLETTY